jgi:hypothetical protein
MQLSEHAWPSNTVLGITKLGKTPYIDCNWAIAVTANAINLLQIRVV